LASTPPELSIPADGATSKDEFSMSSFASRRPPPVIPAGPAAPAKPLENPLEEFASVLGVDVNALQHLGGAEDGAPTLGAAHAPDLARLPPPKPRRPRALTLGIVLVLGVAGGVGAWTLRSASGSPGLSAMEADAPPKAQPRGQATAALRDDAASVSPGAQTGATAPIALASTEKQPSAPPEQSNPPATTPSAAPAPIAMEAAPSAALAAALASASAAPPVTRSIALQASAAEPAQVPASIVAAPTAPPASPEPNRPKAASLRPDASPLPNGDGAPARAKNPAPLSATRTSAAPGDIAPAPLKQPMPAPRSSLGASAAGAPKPAPVKEKLDPPAALHADSGRDQAVARSDAAAPAAPAAADPGSGETADSVLRFVPNLYEKAANALRGSSTTTQVAAADAAPPPTPSAAAAPNGGGFSADSVLQFVPNLYDKAASALRGSPPPTQVARADPKPAAAGVAGDYGVQFAAPASEPAARKESARLRAKFASELGGLQPSVRQTEVHGHKIYQVRIGGLSKADAAALCLKLKSSGEAACSVARD
jgi:hypothetical protein